MNKYTIGWTMTTYYEAEVEAESLPDAKEMFFAGGLDAEIIGDAGDAELAYVRRMDD